MGKVEFYAVTNTDIVGLPVPGQPSGFADLFRDLPLGVYSALRTYEHNKFLDLEAHLVRTQRSMDVLGWDYELDTTRLRQALHEVVTAFPAEEARVRFDVLAQPIREAGVESRIVIALMPFTPVPRAFYEQGVAVDYAPDLLRQRPEAKTADFAQERDQYNPGRDQQAYEYLIVDEGNILEGTMTNFWAVRDGVVRTAGSGILGGVTRKIILSLLPGLGLPVRLVAVQQDEVPFLDEAALSGSSRAFLPVTRIAGQVVGDGRPGPISRRILDAYEVYVAEHIRTAVP